MHMMSIVSELWTKWQDNYYKGMIGPYQHLPPIDAYNALTIQARISTAKASALAVAINVAYGTLWYPPIATWHGPYSPATWASVILVFSLVIRAGIIHFINETVLKRFASENPNQGIPGPISSRIAEFLSKL